jgi:hypothetical protein
MTINNPDKWVVLEMKADSLESSRKVFAGWYGGFAGADRWKLSSGIIGEKDFDQYIEFENVSGSIYRCNKDTYGMSVYMNDIFTSWLERIKDIPDASITVVEEYNQIAARSNKLVGEKNKK